MDLDDILAWLGIIAALVATAILVLVVLGMCHYGPLAPWIWRPTR